MTKNVPKGSKRFDASLPPTDPATLGRVVVSGACNRCGKGGMTLDELADHAAGHAVGRF